MLARVSNTVMLFLGKTVLRNLSLLPKAEGPRSTPPCLHAFQILRSIKSALISCLAHYVDKTYDDLSDDSRLTERLEEEGKKPCEGDNQTYLKNNQGKSVIERIFTLEGPI